MIPEFKKILLVVSIAILLALSPLRLRAAEDQPVDQPTSDPGMETAAADNDGKAKSGKWGNLLPLPIFITEPAIGDGLGIALIYFDREFDRSDKTKPDVTTPTQLSTAGSQSKPPPNATAIFAFKTDDGTDGGGIGRSQTFAEDHYRLRAVVAKTTIFSDIYLGDTPIGFELDGNLLYAELKTRLGDSNTFFGVSVSYLDAGNEFSLDTDNIDLDNFLDLDFVDVGVAASLTYDTRDNTTMPNKGYNIELIGWRHDQDIGSDFDYSLTRLTAAWYMPIKKKYVLSARLDSAGVGGDPPFYAYPYVSLRGVPALRYQGKVASSLEVEGRRYIGDRWSVSLFTGTGTTRIADRQVESADDIFTYGVGTRWLAYRKNDAWIGVDVARGPEETAVYIQYGSSW